MWRYRNVSAITAGDDEGFSGNPIGVRRRQEHHRRGDVLRRSDAARGVCACTCGRKLSTMPLACRPSVSTIPELIALTRILRGLSSFLKTGGRFLAMLPPNRRRFQPLHFNVWNMLPLLARAAHQPRIFQATERRCPSARSERTATAISDLSLPAAPRSRDIANGWHC